MGNQNPKGSAPHPQGGQVKKTAPTPEQTEDDKAIRL